MVNIYDRHGEHKNSVLIVLPGYELYYLYNVHDSVCIGICILCGCINGNACE